jgi:hypothetical protein
VSVIHTHTHSHTLRIAMGKLPSGLFCVLPMQAQQQVALLSELWSRTKPVIAASLAVKETEAQARSRGQDV